MKYLCAIIGTLSCLLIAACASDDGSFPQVADAPPFDFVDGEEMRSRMHQLAFALQNLDSSLTTDYEENPPSQQSVVDELRDIERIAKTLQSGEISSKHPFLVNDMNKFLADVSRAQFDAERNRYYMAGRISGACVTCHRASYY
jgi:hypothetical protein|tara:strand:+ start:68351 stop:68782 length:432 start_codon:yes stop_codon:yes gene_type:complete